MSLTYALIEGTLLVANLLFFWAYTLVDDFQLGFFYAAVWARVALYISVVSASASFVGPIKLSFRLGRSHIERGVSPEKIN